MATTKFKTEWLEQIALLAKCGTADDVVSLCEAIEKALNGDYEVELLEFSPVVQLVLNPIIKSLKDSEATSKRNSANAQRPQSDRKATAKRPQSKEKERETEEDREEESRESKEASPHTPLEENKESKGEEIEEDKEKEREYIRAYAREETALSVDVLPAPAFVPESDPKRLTDKVLEEEFDALWMLYPNKKGRSDALRHYKAARKQGVTYDTIEDGIKRYAEYVKDEDPKFIAMGSTWFCGHRWEDQYARGKPKVGSIEWIANL